ncbi:hypothetical protein [Microbacterium sp.]|uniref:hypothetical protein n=1 Tax=Microbacterium sp. TaxID=51671 RepID=UPI003A8CE050
MRQHRKQRSDQSLDELARTLLVQEHSSLRSEILASYGYAQSIVKWTLATFAAIAAAGLVAVSNATGDKQNPILVDTVMVIFGIGLPAITWLYSFTWIGELYRAERAGSFLRALEAEISAVDGLTARLGFQPVRWESFIWANRNLKKSLWGKQVMTYLGTAAVFLGTSAGSFIILCIVVSTLLAQDKLLFPEWAWAWIVGSLLLNLGCLLVFVLMGARLFRIGKAVAPLRPAY